MAKLFKANGSVSEVVPGNGAKFNLAEVQRYVGGFVSVVYLANGERLLVNEDGYNTGLQVNQLATDLVEAIGSKQNATPVVGDALLCNKRESIA